MTLLTEQEWNALADEAERELAERRAALVDRTQFERRFAEAVERLRRHIDRMRRIDPQAGDIATEGLEQFERIIRTALSGEPESNPSLHKTGETQE